MPARDEESREGDSNVLLGYHRAGWLVGGFRLGIGLSLGAPLTGTTQPSGLLQAFETVSPSNPRACCESDAGYVRLSQHRLALLDQLVKNLHIINSFNSSDAGHEYCQAMLGFACSLRISTILTEASGPDSHSTAGCN